MTDIVERLRATVNPSVYEYEYAREGERAEAAAKIGRMREVLQECEDYFDNRADADGRSDGSFVGNEEMRLLILVRAALTTPTTLEGG